MLYRDGEPRHPIKRSQLKESRRVRVANNRRVSISDDNRPIVSGAGTMGAWTLFIMTAGLRALRNAVVAIRIRDFVDNDVAPEKHQREKRQCPQQGRETKHRHEEQNRYGNKQPCQQFKCQSDLSISRVPVGPVISNLTGPPEASTEI